MGYGIQPYGIYYYGCVVDDLTVVSAVAISTRTVRVTFSKEPQNISAAVTGDVLNPRTWQITRDDTGVGFTILSIAAFDSPLIWDVRVLEPFGSVNIQHTVSAPTLLDTTGSPIDAPRTATFVGALSKDRSTPSERAAQRRYNIRDINNPQAPTADSDANGVFIITDGGDYQLHEGADFIRKLIFRRLMTSRGGFFHLPDYGLGLAVKQPIPSGNLVKLQTEIKNQILLEPEIAKVAVTLKQDQNSLSIVVRARMEPTGQQVTFAKAVPFGVQL